MSTPSTPPWDQPETPGQEEREEPAATPPPAELYVPASERPATDPSQTAELLVTPADEPTFTPAEPGVATRRAEPAWVQLLQKPTLGQGVVLVTGLLLFIWGFLPWYSDAGGSANAWSTETIPGLVMTATWVPLLSLAIVVFVAIKVFGDGFPDKVLGFTWAQIAIMVGLFDVLITLGFLVANRSLGNLGSLDLGAGLILSFITSIVLLAGAVFDHLGMNSEIFNRRIGRR
jgi:hypothetical protein